MANIKGLNSSAGLVVILLVCFSFLASAQIVSVSATYDEPSYLVAGYTYLVGHDYRLFAPPLATKIAAIPLLVLPKIDANCRPDKIFRDRSQSAKYALSAWVGLLGDPFVGAQYPLSHLFLFGPSDNALKRLHVDNLINLPTTQPLSRSDFLSDGELLLNSGRAMMLVFSIALGILIFFWSNELWGLAGAVLSLAFYCFNPNIIANGALVTTDIPLTCLYFSTVYFFYRLTRKCTPWNFAAMCLSFGLAQTAKHSGLLLFPLMFLLLAMQVVRSSDWRLPGLSAVPQRAVGIVSACIVFSALGLSAFICIWWQYDFRYDVTPDTQQAVRQMRDVNAQYMKKPQAFLGHLALEDDLRAAEAARSMREKFPNGNIDYTHTALDDGRLFDPHVLSRHVPAHPESLGDRIAMFVNEHQLLPEAYTFGLMLIKDQTIGRESYLFGKRSLQGFPLYFVDALLLKNPLILLASVAAWAVMFVRDGIYRRFDCWCLLVPVLSYIAVAIIGGYNIGIRHALPIFPFMFVLLGAITKTQLPQQLASKGKPLLAAFVLVIAVSSSLVFAPPLSVQCVFPDYLTYFNELAGGPSNGWRSLLDSNLDWGQGLKPLSSWLKERHITQPVYLCYFGQADPLYEGITYKRVIGGMSYFGQPLNFDQITAPGYFVISANYLHGLGLNPRFQSVVGDFVNRRCSFEALVDNSMFVYRVVK